MRTNETVLYNIGVLIKPGGGELNTILYREDSTLKSNPLSFYYFSQKRFLFHIPSYLNCTLSFIHMIIV